MKYSASRFAGLIIAVTLLLSSTVGYGTTPALAAVGLTSFDVARGDNDSQLVITWTTETEVDILAFKLKRATVEDANAATDVATLPALGSGVNGSDYEHQDNGLTSGTRYYYWLYELTSTGDQNLLTAPKNGTPGGEAQVSPTAPPTVTNPPAANTATPTQPATAVPTATQPAGNAPSTNTPVPTNTQAPTNTPVATNTPIPINTSVAAAAAANAPASTNTPVPTNTPETAEQTNPAASATDTGLPDVQSAPLAVGEATPAPDTGGGERTEQGADVTATPSNPVEEAAATGLNSVDSPTAQAVAENAAQVTTAAPDTQPTIARPTATPRPSRSDSGGSTTGLLAVIGGGSLLAAALLAVVAFFIWRRR